MHFSRFEAPWGGWGGGLRGPGRSFVAPVAPSGTRLGFGIPTRVYGVIPLGVVFEALAAIGATRDHQGQERLGFGRLLDRGLEFEAILAQILGAWGSKNVGFVQ